MTPENLELCARLLVRFCGWRWMREKKRGLCVLMPPFPASFGVGVWMAYPQCETLEQEAEHYAAVSIVPPMDERFADWHRACGVEISTDRHQSGIPRLTESLDACAMLKGVLLSNGLDVETRCLKRNESGGIWLNVKIRNQDEITLASWCDWADAYSAAAEAMAMCRAADAMPEGEL